MHKRRLVDEPPRRALRVLQAAAEQLGSTIGESPRTIKLYAIVGTKLRENADGYTTHQQVPTFYLHPDVSGILDEAQALRMAREICGPGHYSATLVELDL